VGSHTAGLSIATHNMTSPPAPHLRLPVSVLILTRNESADLPGCLQSVSWCDDVHVFDSGSTDDTVAIAQRMGARVVQRTYPHTDAPFGGDEAAHRNWGLREIPYEHPWVLMLDADERCTPALCDAMAQTLPSAGTEVSAYRIVRRDHLLGVWLRHVTPSPHHIRLFRPARLHYERLINPVTVVDGPIVDLATHFDHFPFSKGLSHWFAKHNGYSSLEAREWLKTQNGERLKPSWRIALLGRDVSERRRHQKAIYYGLPGRPLVMFLALYVGKRGFLDGRAGFMFAVLRAMYEYMIVLKVEEMKLTQQERA
jgi:glycosyltransferase involved in cell wall biosynthesis